MPNNFVSETKLPGVFTIQRPLFPDERGFFQEIFRATELVEKTGYRFMPVQSSHSHSNKNVLRGIHVASWTKLVYVPRGTVQQVIVDLRPDSPTFKKHLSIVIGEENRLAVFIPANCGNGHLVLSEVADYIYFIDGYWEKGKEQDLAWNDPDLKILWKVKNPIVSAKDTSAQRLRDLFPKKFK